MGIEYIVNVVFQTTMERVDYLFSDLGVIDYPFGKISVNLYFICS